MQNIPKKIWAIWVNFTAKTNGELTKVLEYFKTRIESQHQPPDWEINIITSYDKLREFIEEEPVLNQIVDNQYINPAHKSDAIRFFLLKKFGGFWIDLSTFLFVSLDIYLDKQPTAKFIGYFTPPFMIEEIIFDPLNKMIDSIKYSKVIKKFKPLQDEYIKLNNDYKDYPFMPENFFIASVQNGEIITDIYEMLINFWGNAIPNITNNDLLCNEINILVNGYAKDIFDINYLDYNLTQIYDNEDMSNDNFKKYTLNRLWNCGYIFNYLQMYIAIVNYIKKNNLEITQEADVENKPDNYNVYASDLCSKEDSFGKKINSCQNVIANSNANDECLYLLSLSHNRIIKWGDSMEERVSFDNTYIDERLNSINNKIDSEKLISDLIEMGIYQIKFSSWTRNSPIIEKLMSKYPPPISGTGGKLRKRRYTKKCKRRKCKKHTKNIQNKNFTKRKEGSKG